ncbi:hypothetical protein [Cellulosimicrobium marinum]|uniref:hypothetical protein n=1 Tax=Cellulosimicrobium marinum TaxID=1638992 RepID=UPI001E3360DD|nr:hypothetical protein [Cellulosimicrobium marinum]MCB7135486.1 hypothetical protein [Cellulosimicrobium marinum]
MPVPPAPWPRRDPRPSDPTPSEPAVPAPVAAALAAAGWSVRDRPGAPSGVVAAGSDGTLCTIHLLDVPEGPTARAALVEHLHGLPTDEQHLAAVRQVLDAGTGTLAVLVEHADGLGLDELVAAREPLDPGEAVTLVVPVAQALAALHRTGRVHGSLDARAVTVAPDGRAVVRPPLTPPGGTPADDVRDLARLVLDVVPPPASSHPAAPSHSLDPARAAALAALHAELVAALRDDPAARPAAGTFAARCYDAVPPSPLVMPDPARLVATALGSRRVLAAPAAVSGRGTGEGGTPPGRRAAREARAGRSGSPTPGPTPVPRRPRRAGRARTGGVGARGGTGPTSAFATAGGGRLRVALLTLGAAVAVGAFVLVGVQVVGQASDPRPDPQAAPAAGSPAETSTEPTTEPATDPTTTDPTTADPTTDRSDPATAARELTARRVALLSERSGELAGVVVPGSAAEHAERAVLAELDGVDVIDARAEVFAVRPGSGVQGEEVAPEVEVEVDYAVGAHRQRVDGTDVHVPASPRTTVVLVLRWTDHGWRVGEVR